MTRELDAKAKIKCSIHLARVYGGDDSRNGTFDLTIEDENASLRFFTATLNAEDIANLISSRTVDVEATIIHPELIGWTHEHKEVVIEWSGALKETKKAADVLRPYEVDGWRGDKDDLFNHHRGSGGKQRVRFYRRVPPTLASLTAARQGRVG